MRVIKLLTLLTLINLAACGSKDTAEVLATETEGMDCSDSALLGSWVSDSGNDLMRFNSDCSGTSSYCGSTFVYPEDTQSLSGHGDIKIIETDGVTGCAPLGSRTYDYEIGESTDGYKYLEIFGNSGTALYWEY